MPKKRIRVITKKQKITEISTIKRASLEQTVREPTFLQDRVRRTSLPLLLPFGAHSSEQNGSIKPTQERRDNSQPEAIAQETVPYDRPGGTNAGNGTTYRIPGATDQTDNQVYRSAGQDNKIETDRKNQFISGTSETSRVQDTSALGKQNQERYQTAQNSYQTLSIEKKKTRELGR